MALDLISFHCTYLSNHPVTSWFFVNPKKNSSKLHAIFDGQMPTPSTLILPSSTHSYLSPLSSHFFAPTHSFTSIAPTFKFFTGPSSFLLPPIHLHLLPPLSKQHCHTL